MARHACRGLRLGVGSGHGGDEVVVGDGERLRHQLVAGELRWPDVFDEIEQQVPELATVRLEEIDRVDPPVPQRPNWLVGWLFRWWMRRLGVPMTDRPRRRPIPKAQWDRGVERLSVAEHVRRLASTATPGDLLDSKAGETMAIYYLLHRFDLQRPKGGEAADLYEQLFSGQATYPDLFAVLVGREPRLDLGSMTEVRQRLTELPVMSPLHQPDAAHAVATDLADSHALVILATQLLTQGDEVLRSHLAREVALWVLADRLEVAGL